MESGGFISPQSQGRAKRFAADAAMEVTADAVQIVGGAGLVRSNPVEKLMRNAKRFQIYEGTGQIQRVVIVCEELRRRAAVVADS